MIKIYFLLPWTRHICRERIVHIIPNHVRDWVANQRYVNIDVKYVISLQQSRIRSFHFSPRDLVKLWGPKAERFLL